MKVMQFIVFSSILSVSSAQADASFDPAKLGKMKGILEVCTKVNPQLAGGYFLQMKSLVGYASKEKVDEAQSTDEYRQAYQSVSDELNNMDQEEMVKACNAYLAAR